MCCDYCPALLIDTELSSFCCDRGKVLLNEIFKEHPQYMKDILWIPSLPNILEHSIQLFLYHLWVLTVLVIGEVELIQWPSTDAYCIEFMV